MTEIVSGGLSMRRAVCTIVAKNYLALAKTLGDSLRDIHPDIDFHLLVVDMAGLPLDGIDEDLITILDPLNLMSIENYNRMAREYDITEFSTALKPFALRYLIQSGYEQVFYFDPDIRIMKPIDEISETLASNNVVLTPHFLDPVPLDGKKPDESTILAAGAYNLGFIGVRATEETIHFLDWWAERLDHLCKIAFCEGLFVDQKWIDLVPGMFDGVAILKDPGYNVAYWNVFSRKVVREGTDYFVGENKTPLTFYHFSGYNTDKPNVLSKHQNRVEFENETYLNELFQQYVKFLVANGHEKYKSLPYTPGIHDGINVAGYLTAELGVGEAARGYVSAIQQLPIKVALNDFSAGTSSRKSDSTFYDFSDDNPYPINLICVNADQVDNFVNHVGDEYIKDKVNVGLWWWELPKFPDKWVSAFNYFDQVWVGSEFARKAVQEASSVPVVCIPPVVGVELEGSYDKEHFGLKNSEFVFLFVFDFLSIFERKNPLSIVKAFKKAFGANDSVRLVLKCINENYDADNFERLQNEIRGDNITIMNGYLSKDEKNGLLAVADCYVSLHRAEGFGYTMAEAMYLKTPVIATGWSGNVDFMNASNSYLVDFDLVELDKDYGPYEKGQVWAEPDIEHAAKLMIQVYESPSEAQKMAEQAAIDIRNTNSIESVSKYIQKHMYVLPRKSGKIKIHKIKKKLMLRFFHSPIVKEIMLAVKRKVPSDFALFVKKVLHRLGWY